MAENDVGDRDRVKPRGEHERERERPDCDMGDIERERRAELGGEEGRE